MPVCLSVYHWIDHAGFITGVIMSWVGRDGQRVATQIPLDLVVEPFRDH